MLLQYNVCVILIIIHSQVKQGDVTAIQCMRNINYNTHSQVKWVILLKYNMCNNIIKHV